MCIKEKTLDGKEVFINVLSWTRIANPDNPDAPIPLYGGMKVGKMPPGSPKVPPLVYAVMASPEVLKKAGRKCPDTPERMNLVDLMCEFVEAMNPSLHLSKKPEILKDRDLSGELKDVWSAVQACRDKGRSDNGPPENLVVYTEFGPDTYSQEVQSAINSQVPEARDAIEQRSPAACGPTEPDGPTNGINTATSRPPAAASTGDEELAKQTESLKLSSSAHRTNGGLPADCAASTTATSSSTTTMTSSSSSSSSTVPQTQTSPTAPNANNVSTAPTDAKGVTVNGGADGTDADGGGGGAASPKTTKPAGKKSGLYFFRRNKSSTSSSSSDSKKETPSTPTKQPSAASVTLPAALTSAASAPATPAATGAACTGSSEPKLIYQYSDHQYHLDAGTNGNGGAGVGGGGNGTGGTGGGGAGDIIETASSATTIVAK
ncbi:hypothetical protein ZHAS_00017417 [Anopheles sinensis]|uniref:Uncharacterized protein n=1 Tax=Anopheles sinensis TaxID=74873 RepID=A0A084WGF8_ANOSI|nr:hypothetical protein ZHAS_00017417 [Anopheles sinensis]